ncbi:unnamed protein product [Brassicogethes aeneus]|uniref:C2H2-type domain-containing protein n=1 Tax=Brassicogethes aeneus TaxID=1431903 RepID=A0A9P0AW26_BRAAE|nr:unnamed protein product [Brassicogethes aeneus]
MEQIVIKKEPEELVDDSKGDISMNYDELSTAADQKTILTSGIAIKQEIKEELDDFKALLEIGSEFNSDDERGDLCSNVKEEEMDCEFFEEVDTEFFNNEDNEEKVEDKAMSEIKIEVEYHGVQSDKSGINSKGKQEEKDDVEKLKCNKCEYATAKKGHFNRHLKIHDKKSHLKCHFCQYTAARLINLQAHILSKHRIENKEKNKIKITGLFKKGI